MSNSRKNSIISTFVSLFYALSLAEDIIAYMPSQNANKEKHLFDEIYTTKNTDSSVNWTPFHPFPSSQAASSPSFKRKVMGLTRKKWTSQHLLPVDNFNQETNWSKVFYNWGILKKVFTSQLLRWKKLNYYYQMITKISCSSRDKKC